MQVLECTHNELVLYQNWVYATWKPNMFSYYDIEQLHTMLYHSKKNAQKSDKTQKSV